MNLEQIAEKAARRTTAGATFQDTLNQMSPAQLNSLVLGVYAVCDWFGGDFRGRFGEGKLVVSKPAPKIADMTLLINTMYWISKFFAPASIKGWKKAYRLHDMRDTKQRGDQVLVKPQKPILSWTDIENPRVDFRGYEADDVIISLDNPKVIFSYKTVQELRGLKFKVTNDHTDDLKKALGRLISEMKNFKNERELVVYTGLKPFRATLVADLSPKARIPEIEAKIKSIGLNPKSFNLDDKDPFEPHFKLKVPMNQDEAYSLLETMKTVLGKKFRFVENGNSESWSWDSSKDDIFVYLQTIGTWKTKGPKKYTLEFDGDFND